MHYKLFLHTLSQLNNNGRATIVFEDNTIYVNSMKSNKWRLSTLLYEGRYDTPSEVHCCMSSTGILRWQQRGAYLQRDASSDCISLIEEIDIQSNKYLSFKNHIVDFIQVSKEWKEIFN